MRSDGIASLKEALAQAGLDSQPNYVASQVMAERLRHRHPAKLTTKSRWGANHPTGLIGTTTWIFLILLLMLMLVTGAFILGKKSRAAPVAPCYAEAHATLFSL